MQKKRGVEANVKLPKKPNGGRSIIAQLKPKKGK